MMEEMKSIEDNQT
jgi:hypothetical protein